MPKPILEISGASIVLVGSFNPLIFQPEWFARLELLPQTEADNATIQVIHPEVAQFDTERFYFQATTTRLTAGTKANTVAEPLKDLVHGVFYILEHTPVQMMGINRQMHFDMHSEDAWHQLGDKIAPKEIWTKVIGERRPGLRNVEILYVKGKGDPFDIPQVTVLVQPSTQVTPHGAYFEINNHFSALPEGGLKQLMEVMNNQWERLQNDAERIATDVLAWAAE
jgi:hypothetical protein